MDGLLQVEDPLDGIDERLAASGLTTLEVLAHGYRKKSKELLDTERKLAAINAEMKYQQREVFILEILIGAEQKRLAEQEEKGDKPSGT